MIVCSFFILQIQSTKNSDQKNVNNYIFSETTTTLSHLNSWDEIYGISNSLAVDGDFAYVGIWDLGILIFDISDINSPRIVSHFETHTPESNILMVYNNLLFVDTFIDGIYIFDVSNAYNPVLISIYNNYCSTDVSGFAIRGNLCFSSSISSGLAIFDISDPYSPTIVSHFEDPYYNQIYDVDVYGGYAYLACNDKGIMVLNVTNPSSPSNITSFNNGGYSSKIFIHGLFAFTIDRNNILEIIDIKNPSSITMISSYTNSSFDMIDVVVENNITYICGGNLGVEIIDTTDILSPTKIGSVVVDLWSYVSDIAIENAGLYLADYEHGLIIIDVTPGFDPEIVSVYPTNGYVNDLAINDDFIFLASSNISLVIVNATDVSNLHTIGILSEIGNAWSLEYYDNRVFLGDKKNGLVIVDVSDPTHPTKLIEYQPSIGRIYDLKIGDIYAYLVGEEGMEIIDITDIYSINFIDSYQDNITSMRKIQVAVDEIYYTISSNNKFNIFEMNAITGITKIGEYQCSHYVEDFFIDNDLVYLIGFNDLTIIDISTPSSPIYLNEFTSPNHLTDVYVYEGVAILLEWYYGIRILDITNTLSLTEILFLDVLENQYNEIVISDNRAYIANGFDGLDVLSIEVEGDNNETPTTTTPLPTITPNGTGEFTINIPGFTLFVTSSGFFILEVISVFLKRKRIN